MSSDLKRALATAAVVSRVVASPIEATSALRERSFGEWEGMLFEEVRSKFEAAQASTGSPFHVRPPGGESLLDVWERIARIVERLKAMQEQVAVVTHGGTCSLLLAQLLGQPIEATPQYRFGNTAVTELGREGDGPWVLKRFADTSHLDQPSSPMIDTVRTTG